LHHARDFESGNRRLARGKKHALNLRGEFHVLKKIVTLLLDRFGKQFPLPYVPPDDVDDKGEAQQSGEIAEDSKVRMDRSWGVIIMEQDTKYDETVAEFLA
jgi:hypothetical protein